MVRLDTLTIEIPAEGTAVALGFFDGLHKGHMEVIGRALAQRESGLVPCVFTFTTHRSCPSAKLQGTLLLTEEQRISRLEELGVEYVICPDFDDFKELTPAEFVETLARVLKAKVLCCGEDFRFGSGASAGIEELKVLCAPYGITVQAISKVTFQGEEISSTRIRRCIREGLTKEATEMLGQPYTIFSEVVHGKRLGRNLGFPTANQYIPGAMTAPKPGVYATFALVEGRRLPAVTSIGKQPTVGGDDVISESYIMGFSGDLYGKTIGISLIAYLRPIERYNSLEELKEQIGLDANMAEEILRNYNDSF